MGAIKNKRVEEVMLKVDRGDYCVGEEDGVYEDRP